MSDPPKPFHYFYSFSELFPLQRDVYEPPFYSAMRSHLAGKVIEKCQ